MSDFLFISIGLVSAATFGSLARFFKQPAIIGFLVAGVLLGNLAASFTSSLTLFGTLSQLGVTLLLFLVGLEMDLKQLTHISKTALFVGTVQMSLTFALVVAVSLFLHLGFPSALFLGLALSFSSTIVAVKLLSEKQELATLHGRITIGILLFQDIIAIFSLVLLNRPATSDFSLFLLLSTLLKAFLLFGFIWIVGKKPLPWLFSHLASYPELIFVASIAWALGLSALVSLPQIGFSIEIGGFLAGLSLASSSEHLQIASRIRPVRDFFLTLFFLSLGMQLELSRIGPFVVPAILLALFVIFAKPLIVTASLGFLGYRRRTSFLTATSLSQISEFSFILLGLASRLNYVNSSLVSLVVLIGAFTMSVSAYLITNGSQIYIQLRHHLKFFERAHTRESVWRPQTIPEDHILLLGCDRTGRGLLPILREKTHPLLIVDSNPKIVRSLIADGFSAAYGDTADLDLLEEIHLDKAHLIISTVPDLTDNLLILEKIRHLPSRPLFIVIAEHPKQALQLYEAGADYVLVPRLLTGAHLARLLAHHEGKSFFAALKRKQLQDLTQNFLT